MQWHSCGFYTLLHQFTVPKAFKLLWYLLYKLAKQSICMFANEHTIRVPLCLSGAKRICCPSLIFRCVMTEPTNIIILPSYNAEYVHAYVNQMQTLLRVSIYFIHIPLSRTSTCPHALCSLSLTCHRHLF